MSCGPGKKVLGAREIFPPPWGIFSVKGLSGGAAAIPLEDEVRQIAGSGI